MMFTAGHYLIDICLNFLKMQKSTPKFSVLTSWWRCKAWEYFYENFKFFGQNSAFELKIDDVIQIDNYLNFPKHPSKSRLSHLIIEIIALIKSSNIAHKQQKLWSNWRSNQNTSASRVVKSSKYLHDEWKCVIGYMKIFLIRICSQGKNSKEG